MTSLVVSIKQHNTQSRRSLEILKRCSSNLASGLYITKEAKWHLSCHCHDNMYVAGPVLIKNKIPRFYPKQGSSTHNNLLGIVKAIWEPIVCRAKPSVPLQKIANGHYLVFYTKRLEPRVLPWQQHSTCHAFSFVMYISGAKFEEHCSNISGVILDWVLHRFSGTTYDVILSSFA